MVALDHLHIIGKNVYSGKTKKRKASVGRFTAFKHRPMFYRDRKSLSENRVHFDLNKEICIILEGKTFGQVKKIWKKSVFVDVNYQLKIGYIPRDHLNCK